jgi:hypothetical protein
MQGKSKEIQGERLGFPWIPLAESGLFNGLWRIQIKKSFSLGFGNNTSIICDLPHFLSSVRADRRAVGSGE